VEILSIVSNYLDPGSGSVIIQFLIGGLAALAIMLKMYWFRIKEKLFKKPA